VAEFALASEAFRHGDPIPRRHTCDGDDVSPALSWSDAPPGTPRGHGPHRYFFRLHALDAELDVGSRASRRELESALSGHVLTTGELMGTYER
jgi:phosphatidylethanolamine-binding protein (PEBP) family uncharacterized protein